jgi:SAM-dependent methyltransferase
MSSTADAEYTARLAELQGAPWKRLLRVQEPYKRIISRYCQGKVLEIGSGIGRNLRNLQGRAVGIDTNADAVEFSRKQGFRAYTPESFMGSPDDVPGSYDALLLAHVLEHVDEQVGNSLIGDYLKYLKPGGNVMLICPQERGYASDHTHIRWVDFDGLESHRRANELESVRSFSFPFPRSLGKTFIYNEFIHVMRYPGN